MIISIVVAADEKNGIGKNNQLPWYLPADLKHFREFTIGYPVIMGRKTFDSVEKPLAKRRNIVITTQNLEIEGCEVVHSINEAIEKCKGEERIAIVGGATIFEQSMDLVDVIHFTRIHNIFEADTFFPAINPDKWIQADIERHEPDEKNMYPYSFITYRRA
ncbi:MAG TPA: dihydrofolate reductase [Sphingobacteriaceae bacterium]|nr:dihydrofolate reductase [Sphingobacteriaceae bacterium]